MMSQFSACHSSVSSRTWTLNVYPFMVYSLTVWTSWTCNICTNKWATLSIFALLCRGACSLYSSVNSLNLELDNLANCCSLLCLEEPIFDNRRKKAAFSKLVFKFEEGILADYIYKKKKTFCFSELTVKTSLSLRFCSAWIVHSSRLLRRLSFVKFESYACIFPCLCLCLCLCSLISCRSSYVASWQSWRFDLDPFLFANVDDLFSE